MNSTTRGELDLVSVGTANEFVVFGTANVEMKRYGSEAAGKLSETNKAGYRVRKVLWPDGIKNTVKIDFPECAPDDRIAQKNGPGERLDDSGRIEPPMKNAPRV